MTRPNGTLMNSTERQPNHSVSNPPTIKPIANPALDIPENRASTRIRALGSVNVVVSSARVFGPAMAPPMPWSTRAASNHPADGARPPASEATVNSTTPAMNMVRLPNRSPARPPSSNRPPKTSV